MRYISGSTRFAMFASSALAATVWTAGQRPAKADVEIKSEIKVTGSLSALGGSGGRRGSTTSDSNSGTQPSTSSSTTPPETTYSVTSYFKGTLARREITGQTMITLYDASSKKVTLINPQLKTYCILSEKEAAKIQVSPLSIVGPNGIQTAPSGMTIDTTMAVDATGLTQSTLGTDTHKYTAYGSVSLVRDQQSGSGGSGGGGYGGGGYGRGRRGGGGTSGSRGPGGPPPGGSRNPSTEFDGEYWLADSSNLPEGGKGPVMPLYQLSVPDGPIMAALYGKVAHLKMMPMASKMIFGNSFANLTTNPAVVIEMAVKSIESNPVDVAMFKVPDGYQQIKSDAMQRQAELATAQP